MKPDAIQDPFNTPPDGAEAALVDVAFDPLIDVLAELARAFKRFPKMNSAHEGWAIMKEEVDELWDQVRKPSGQRTAVNLARMRREATQVAAMALRFIIDCCEPV